MPTILFFMLLPKLSVESITSGLILNKISSSTLLTLKSIVSEVDIVINFETSKIIFTSLLSISIIISFFFNPASAAGLST